MQLPDACSGKQQLSVMMSAAIAACRGRAGAFSPDASRSFRRMRILKSEYLSVLPQTDLVYNLTSTDHEGVHRPSVLPGSDPRISFLPGLPRA